MPRETPPDFDRLAETITPDQLARALEIRKDGGSWHCPLPGNHENGDKEPSFSIYRRDGRTGGRCHGGDCDLRGSPITVASVVWGVDAPEAARRLARSIGMTVSGNGRREIESTYDYVDEDGDLLFQVVRFRPKAFRQRAPDGENGWHWSTKGVRRVLYRLPAVLEAVQAGDRVFLTEGEKDVEALVNIGFCATCNPGGAGKWRDSYTRTLAGARVGIIADADDAGREHAWSVARELEDVAEKVVVLEPAYGNDVSDHLTAGLTLADLKVVEEPPEEGSGDADPGFLDSLDLDWGPPIPLGPETPDDLPPEILPSPLRGHVESVAASTQTPTALPLSMALAAVSTAVAGKAIVTVRAGWEGEPLNTYWAAVLNPGERKSPVERKMAAPLREHDRQAASRLGPDHRASLDREAALEKRLKRAQRAFADADGAAEEGEALDALEDARQRLEDLEIEAPPRLLTNDVTSEALGRMMANNAGRAAILSSEGDVLRIFAGKYSSGDPTLDLLKKAHDGDPVRVDRVGRDGVHLPCPLLTVGITLQPALLKGLANRDALEGEGVLARFLWVAPPSMVGHRKTGADVPRPDEAARDQYERLLARLLETEPAGIEEDGQWKPHTLELTPEARSHLYDWEADVEQMLAPGGELAALGFWGNKAVGRTLRLAGLFHVVERAGRGEGPFAAPVGVEPVQDAIRLARSLVSHARFVLVAEMGADLELTLAEYLLRRIRELTSDDGDPPSTSDLLQAVKQKRGLETAEKLDATLGTLEAHNQIRRVERPSEGPGRNPAPLVLLNPESPKEVQEIQEKGSGRDSLDFLDASQGSDHASAESTEDDADSEPAPVPTGNEIIGDGEPADPNDVGEF